MACCSRVHECWSVRQLLLYVSARPWRWLVRWCHHSCQHSKLSVSSRHCCGTDQKLRWIERRYACVPVASVLSLTVCLGIVTQFYDAFFDPRSVCMPCLLLNWCPDQCRFCCFSALAWADCQLFAGSCVSECSFCRWLCFCSVLISDASQEEILASASSASTDDAVARRLRRGWDGCATCLLSYFRSAMFSSFFWRPFLLRYRWSLRSKRTC